MIKIILFAKKRLKWVTFVLHVGIDRHNKFESNSKKNPMKNLTILLCLVFATFASTFAQRTNPGNNTTLPTVWTHLPGNGYGKNIASDANGKPWVIAMNNSIYSFNGTIWEPYGSGFGLDIAVYGTTPYVIGLDNRIFKGTGSGFVEMPGGGAGKCITVDQRTGKVWVIGMDNGIFYHNGTTWIRYPNGLGLDIAVYNGVPYVIGMDGRIFKGTGSDFVEVPGNGYGKRIAIDSANGQLYVTGTDDGVFTLQNNIWKRMSTGYGLDLTVNKYKLRVIGMDNTIFKGE